MDKEQVRKLLEEVKTGRVDINDAVDKFRGLPFQDLGFACLDTHRELRTGFPEVIYCSGKTTEQVVQIFGKLAESERTVMATRAEPEVYRAVVAQYPDAQYFEAARIILSRPVPQPRHDGVIAVVTAGTSDMPVAEEAAVTAEAMRNKVERLFDVGVAGIHRLLHRKDTLFRANVIVVVAGMEGALASVVGGMVDQPVIAVPTSVGYGASFQGLAALLSMLNCCAPGVAVMNIDNGFGAGYFAAIVNGSEEK